MGLFFCSAVESASQIFSVIQAARSHYSCVSDKGCENFGPAIWLVKLSEAAIFDALFALAAGSDCR